MTESGFLQLKSTILELLRTDLDQRLTYHCLAHTEDVLEQAQRIALTEGIADPKLLLLIKIAALFHDTGFLHTYKGHEEESCRIMEEYVRDPDLTKRDIEMIKGMIRATKVPQTPHNLPEKILCDADLDYLGRDDFKPISETLKDEFLVYGIIKTEQDWDDMQVSFFESHRYFTGTSLQNRHPLKMKHLQALKQKVLK
ncbi:HD domain-containing protein [Terrimonas pollutisoli]|uniref:HD domain-containing protein n=1 Tax=Terrimonas pollutisoli TaxID=3034147 RepID=UPI0023EC5568|nr:HD domain-containing protein [Terrimonas sp. H1YJ31]